MECRHNILYLRTANRLEIQNVTPGTYKTCNFCNRTISVSTYSPFAAAVKKLTINAYYMF